MRQIVLDTETTGLAPEAGHRIIEIGCIEIHNRRITDRRYHQYLNPERDIDAGAIEVHGLTSEFLSSKPKFADVAAEFLEYIDGAELIIHNAPFDIGFLDHELARLESGGTTTIAQHCTVFDTLPFARELHPGQRNSLDALCRRYEVDNAHRDLHGALLDAELLADVYLAMTGGQVDLQLAADGGANVAAGNDAPAATVIRRAIPVVLPNTEELAAHRANLERIEAASDDGCLWLRADFQATDGR
jgi:DNA polymerase-3 subunit epsilon